VVLHWPIITMSANAGVGALLAAGKNNDVEALLRALSAGVSVNATNQIGQTALHVASIWGNSKVVQALLQGRADTSASNQFGVTPLHYAAQNGKYEVAQLLLAAGADTKAEAKNGMKPYETAKEDEMRALCGGPAMALHAAVKRRDLAQLRELVAAEGTDLAEQDPDGQTAVHLAVQAALAKDGSDGDGSCGADEEAMAILSALLAVAEGSTAASLRLAHELHAADGTVPLHLAAARGDGHMVQMLLESGASVDAKTRLRGHMFNGDWVRRAADGSVDPLSHLGGGGGSGGGDGGKKGGATSAAVSVIQQLLSRGADTNARDKDMRTPLHQAVAHGLYDVAEMLLASGADPSLGCKAIGMESSALHQATMKGDAKMVELLLRHGRDGGSGGRLDVDCRGRGGWTALCLAARSGNVDVAKALLAAGADPGLRMENGKTASEIAHTNKKAALVALLDASAQ
jgi:ankyrin repeat protein